MSPSQTQDLLPQEDRTPYAVGICCHLCSKGRIQAFGSTDDSFHLPPGNLLPFCTGSMPAQTSLYTKIVMPSYSYRREDQTVCFMINSKIYLYVNVSIKVTRVHKNNHICSVVITSHLYVRRMLLKTNLYIADVTFLSKAHF